VALISGGAKFCTGLTCRPLSKSCDYVEVMARKISEPKRVSNGFTRRGEAAKIFPSIAIASDFLQGFTWAIEIARQKTQPSTSKVLSTFATLPKCAPNPYRNRPMMNVITIAARMMMANATMTIMDTEKMAKIIGENDESGN
jgi:hypothetical protein